MKLEFSLFKILQNVSFGYLILFFGFFFLLIDPIFYLILFYLTGVDLSFKLLFFYSIDLIGFFLHLSPLDVLVWSDKEILHYIDVRNIFDKLIIFAFACALFLRVNYKKVSFACLGGVVKVLRWIVLLPLLILPVFSWFWNEVFHSVLFSNDLWLMVPSDLSYHIFNEWFFILFYVFFVLVEFGIFYLIKDIRN